MGTQTEEQRKLDAEGKRIAQDVAAQLNMTEGKITKQNEAWLKSGGDGVIGAGNDSKGTKSFNAETHRTAKKLGAK
jgi:hypothetical protein